VPQVDARVKYNGALRQFASLQRLLDNPILDIADFTALQKWTHDAKEHF
jgi:hypothetical protein